jgi:hypothetical protein
LATDVVAQLRAAGCVFAEDEAALLLEAASSEVELADLIARRLAGEPLEYIVGSLSSSAIGTWSVPGSSSHGSAPHCSSNRQNTSGVERSSICAAGVAHWDLLPDIGLALNCSPLTSLLRRSTMRWPMAFRAPSWETCSMPSRTPIAAR